MYDILIVSSEGRKKVVAEIWYNNSMIVEINQEKNAKLEIELFCGEKDFITLDLEDFLLNIEEAKNRLLGGTTNKK